MKAFTWFEMALKYEKNPKTVARLKEKMVEYMDRAEMLKKMLNEAPKKAAAAAAAASTGGKDGSDDDGADVEKGKLRGGLESAVLMEKPNVKWDDVAGLETAKEALKEAVIMPIKFPHLFKGHIKPWKGIFPHFFPHFLLMSPLPKCSWCFEIRYFALRASRNRKVISGQSCSDGG